MARQAFSDQSGENAAAMAPYCSESASRKSPSSMGAAKARLKNA